jgi:hypothetical protein
VAGTAWEALLNAVAGHRRDQVRALIQGGPTQVGLIIAGIIGLLGIRALDLRLVLVLGGLLA